MSWGGGGVGGREHIFGNKGTGNIWNGLTFTLKSWLIWTWKFVVTNWSGTTNKLAKNFNYLFRVRSFWSWNTIEWSVLLIYERSAFPLLWKLDVINKGRSILFELPNVFIKINKRPTHIRSELEKERYLLFSSSGALPVCPLNAIICINATSNITGFRTISPKFLCCVIHWLSSKLPQHNSLDRQQIFSSRDAISEQFSQSHHSPSCSSMSDTSAFSKALSNDSNSISEYSGS